ncbi:sulfotransferase family protein [Streptomyces uncialis]|uniref:sulfotransferase family protein n=1 Tax=Streptomyces uncialis TaxID=1048205 RepID=UPI0037AEFC95|nr:sulfotransferase family protein [Streptomyces uncialis]
MDIIGAGLGRTGTTSLKQALDILGFGPVYHTKEIFREPRRLADWETVVHGGEQDWGRVFDGYRATVDWPGAAYWKELSDYYPEAQVILTTRNPQAWYTSCRNTIFISYRRELVWRVLLPLMRIPLLAADKRLRNFRQVFDVIFRRHFGNRPIDDQHAAVSVFQEHTERVRVEIAPGRLLEYQVAQGWEPLCEFLGVPVPDDPFPHENDRGAWKRFTRSHVLHGLRKISARPLRGPRGESRRRSAETAQWHTSEEGDT